MSGSSYQCAECGRFVSEAQAALTGRSRTEVVGYDPPEAEIVVDFYCPAHAPIPQPPRESALVQKGGEAP